MRDAHALIGSAVLVPVLLGAWLYSSCRGEEQWSIQKRLDCERPCTANTPTGTIYPKDGTQRPETDSERAFYGKMEKECLQQCEACATARTSAERYRLNCPY